MMKLSDAGIGDVMVVERNEAIDNQKERLLALGLTKGAMVEVIRKGPKNNLTVFKIRGAMIALRNEESGFIFVN